MDVAQEVWIKVFRALPRFREGATFRSWLFSIALNATRDEGRRRQRHPSDSPEALWPIADPKDMTQQSSIDEALQRVPEPFRSTLQLVDVEKFSYQEAATALGCNIGTVRSRLSRGRHAFREQWESDASRSVAANTGTTR
jgi:RNA polymerase sigma-70 factor (ECF subfamily)